MKMLIEELQGLAADPRSWGVVALMAIVATLSIVNLLRCRYVSGSVTISDDAVRAARETIFTPGPRFGIMMLAGTAAAITGLFMIANGIKPTFALAAMVAGVVIIQTEPSRLMIRENTQRVIACRDEDPATRHAAIDRLRASHRKLAAMNVILLAGLIAALLAF